MKLIIVFLTLLTALLSSCSIYKIRSTFAAETILPGISKSDFIKRYGIPFNSNVSYDEHQVLDETLFYKETLCPGSWVTTTTAFRFKDGKLINKEVVKDELVHQSCDCKK